MNIGTIIFIIIALVVFVVIRKYDNKVADYDVNNIMTTINQNTHEEYREIRKVVKEDHAAIKSDMHSMWEKLDSIAYNTKRLEEFFKYTNNIRDMLRTANAWKNGTLSDKEAMTKIHNKLIKIRDEEKIY
jgi:hypothetical protein